MASLMFLSDLKFPLKNPAIRVKVIIKWNDDAARIRGQTEMVFGDEKGSTIQGTVVEHIMRANRTVMGVGEWYEILNFNLIHNFRLFRTTKNRFHLITGGNTVIRKVQATKGCNYYCFKEFKTITRGLAHPMYSVDVYGAMVNVSDIEYVGHPGGPIKPKKVFSLVNPGYKNLRCVAYGSNALEIEAYWNSTRAHVVLCVMSFWQIERVPGQVTSIKNIDGCSKIEFEPNIPEIEAFRRLIPPNAY